MDEHNLLFQVIKAFAGVDLSPERVDNMQMGYVFEELIRIGAEQSNEEAGHHFTPREVIRLMVSLILSSENRFGQSPCGQDHLRSRLRFWWDVCPPRTNTSGNTTPKPTRSSTDRITTLTLGRCAKLTCSSRGENADNIVFGDTFLEDGYQIRPRGAQVDL